MLSWEALYPSRHVHTPTEIISRALIYLPNHRYLRFEVTTGIFGWDYVPAQLFPFYQHSSMELQGVAHQKHKPDSLWAQGMCTFLVVWLGWRSLAVESHSCVLCYSDVQIWLSCSKEVQFSDNFKACACFLFFAVLAPHPSSFLFE